MCVLGRDTCPRFHNVIRAEAGGFLPLLPRPVSFVVFIHPLGKNLPWVEIDAHALWDPAHTGSTNFTTKHRILVHPMGDLDPGMVLYVFRTAVYVGWHYLHTPIPCTHVHVIRNDMRARPLPPHLIAPQRRHSQRRGQPDRNRVAVEGSENEEDERVSHNKQYVLLIAELVQPPHK